jgi:hypothetical protein
MDNEITMCGYSILTSVECTSIMIAELTVISSLGSSGDYMGFGESVRLGVNPCPLWDNSLCLHLLLSLGYC